MKKFLQSDWFAALLFLIAYLLTNSYIYAWDDQHLEIPLLKHLIDPSLYKGDYYVEGLAGKFSSYLYPILAKCISTAQVPAAYLVLFLISRYMMLYWVYRLWQWIAGEKWAAAMAVLMFVLMGRTEEFLYRTFSHQEFSYIFMFGGFYYFYRERFILAAMLFGLGANFHAIYSLFPMLYMLAFLLFCRKDRWPMAAKAGLAFALFALPFLLWQIPKSLARSGHVPVGEWMPLYLISCQQNFLFWTLPLNEAFQNTAFVLGRLGPYLFLLGLYALLCVLEPKARSDKKLRALVAVAYVLILVSFVFSYIVPSRFVVDLNLLRNEQFARFMLMGYATVFACRLAKEGKPWQVLFAGMFLLLAGFNGLEFFILKLKKYAYVPALFIVLFIGLHYRPRWPWLRRAFIILPIAASFISFTLYHYQYIQARKSGAGLWQMHRNWVDMQKHVRAHTPKDALILAPYDTETGGFRIYSERKILACYRDCGIIGFDYNAAVEWRKRIKDIEEFKVMTNQSIDHALINAIFKYKVDYIVFMNYYQPREANPVLAKMYQNEVFALYKVNR
ncbi:MAG: DUF2029 domain-containing protein [Candidatus Omnitrophica bacterium]|nr:DUF2029 domain-containing protein [Candidatus Omnitrophota bacterium]